VKRKKIIPYLETVMNKKLIPLDKGIAAFGKWRAAILATVIIGGTLVTIPWVIAAPGDDGGMPPPPVAGDAAPGQSQDGNIPAPQHRGPRMPPELARALSKLTLTDAEKTQIKKIAEDFRKKQEALRDQLLQQLKAVLTPDQYTQVEESMKQPPPPPPGQGGQGGGGGGGPDGNGGGGGGGGNDNGPPPPPNQ
jgi:hypothetical protein